MASQDFVSLMTKLHKERYDVLSIRVDAERAGDSFSTVATAVLRKGGEQIVLQSSEMDFVQYLVELRGVVHTDGEYRFRRVKDLNQYNVDAEHLIDQNRSKLKKAADEIRSGAFRFTYSPPKLIDELLKGARNLNDPKFLPLKRDYHHILANAFLMSREMLKAHKRLIRKYPEAKKTYEAIDTIMKSFRPTNNAIRDWKFYRSFLSFDIGELADRMSTQLKVKEDIVQDFIRRGKIDADVAIPRMMGIYRQFLELSAPVINLLRIGMELKRDNVSPQRGYKLRRNIEILKSNSDFGSLFGCLDEQIRHADAHASIRIDKKTRTVCLIDARGKKERVVSTYTFDGLTEKINIVQNQFFPAVFPTIVLFDIAALDLLLVSPEYKHLLLAVGNI